jgi:hypothetical protein
LGFNPSQSVKSLDKDRHIRLKLTVSRNGIHEHANNPHSTTLLRPCHHRPRCRTDKRRNELPPSHPCSPALIGENLSRPRIHGNGVPVAAAPAGALTLMVLTVVFGAEVGWLIVDPPAS